jgi:hypothetical protein
VRRFFTGGIPVVEQALIGFDDKDLAINDAVPMGARLTSESELVSDLGPKVVIV